MNNIEKSVFTANATKERAREEEIKNRLITFRQWLPESSSVELARQLRNNKQLPESKKVQEILKRYTSNGAPLDLEEAKAIIGGLLERAEFLGREAFIDPSTGHLNKNAFHSALANIIENKKSGKEQEPTTVVVIDLNYLKPLNNESYGGCGNKAIDYLVDFVSNGLRHSKLDKNAPTPPSKKQSSAPHKETGDLFTRLGNGDEFAVIMENCTPEKARERIRPILEKMAQESINGEKPCIGTNKKEQKTNIQISAAFGCVNLSDFITANDSPSDIIHATLKKAGEIEFLDKERSKKHAANIDGGFPACRDRQNAEEIIGKFLKKKFDPDFVDETLFRDKIRAIGIKHGRRLEAQPRSALKDSDSSFAKYLAARREDTGIATPLTR